MTMGAGERNGTLTAFGERNSAASEIEKRSWLLYILLLLLNFEPRDGITNSKASTSKM